MNSKQHLISLSSSSPAHFLFYVVIFLISIIVSAGNETDHEALLMIKSMITQDPYGALTTWNSSFHFCDWRHVYCGKRHRRVIGITLESHGLEGSLSPYVGNLSFLRMLSLYNNSFHGAIPHELGRLYRLRIMRLYQNKFIGAISTNISGCVNLEEIGLSDNELVGRIPDEISFLSKLTFLSLFSNKLTGGISSFLGNLTSLKVFSVCENPLGGSIPHTLGRLKSLRQIYFCSCNLYRTIPDSLYNLSHLTDIGLYDNQLTGSLHQAMGGKLPNLVRLFLWGNQLTGPLPPSISNCSRLRFFEMAINKFSGKVTIDFANLRDIYKIDLSNNIIGNKEADGLEFIDILKNCTKLAKLVLNDCNFQGVLPSSIGNLSNQLGSLYLYGNQLHGNIPRSIGNLVGLEKLFLEANQFTGNIPSTIGNLQKLQLGFLADNQLSGQIPNAIGNLSLLLKLDLSLNMLEGVIPSSLGKCQNLLALYLHHNNLNGRIPTQLLQLSSLSINLDLSQNNLSGLLPTEVGNLKKLTSMDLSDNILSGNIPSTLGGCDSLLDLFLKGNLFQGMIPSSLSFLKGLMVLDISHNNLSGKIPRFFVQFKLEYLNLSYNDFEGEVPMIGVFANLSAFSVLGNGKLCGGFVELRLPKCKETNKSNKKPHILLIAILIVSTLFTITCLACAWFKKKSKNHLSQSTMSKRFLQVSYGQLLKATNGFSEANLIGSGGFSSVYKGIIDEDEDRFIAVKVLHLQNAGAQRSFMRECEAWRSIRHRNLLKIITSCSSVDYQGNDFKALVYEFMPNGSLHDWLHPTLRLNLLQIVNILIDIASALDYIHNHCIPSVVHGDLKPSNILLDDDMVAHVGDFGLVRFLGSNSYQNSSTGIIGTIGYVAPEYGLGNELTSEGDVYSFGIILLEAMTGKMPIDNIFNEGHNIHKFAFMALPNNVTDVIDVNLLNTYHEDGIFMQKTESNIKKIEECLSSIIKIGVSCTMDSPPQRMDIKKVVHELQHIMGDVQNI